MTINGIMCLLSFFHLPLSMSPDPRKASFSFPSGSCYGCGGFVPVMQCCNRSGHALQRGAMSSNAINKTSPGQYFSGRYKKKISFVLLENNDRNLIFIFISLDFGGKS